jgi:hypothetical protein
MRAIVAAGLAVFLLVVAAGPHVHTGPHGADDCAVCVARHADVASPRMPDVAPVRFVCGEPVAAPTAPPVSGAPLGAIPGQSPPHAS